jgi:hypothetical protein
MQSINIFSGNISNPEVLENLKNNLDFVGVKAFTVDFENQAVSIVSHLDLSNEEIQCVFPKSGLNCSCIAKCNKSED